jgi:hypothetical protein
MNNEPVAIRYDFDGYGYQYMDSGSGSDWQTRVDGELLYADPACKHGVDDGACKECYQDATEPVAWMIDTLDGKHLMLYGSNPPPVFDSEVNAIPLYTHPVKELTDEEIHQAFRDTWDATVNPNCVFTAFARAILRKAQENET